jgi:ankyrin repeat protein
VARVSKTRLLELVKQLRAKDAAAALRDNPALLGVRDKRGRTWLHLACGVNVKERGLKSADAIATARALLDAGLELEDAAFTEEENDFRATPLWYAIAWGKNVALTKFLLERGAVPNHCLWAAAFNDDVEALRLLARHGAPLDASAEDASPFLFAVQWSRFRAAEELLELGADVNFKSAKGMTALHHMLKKGSDHKHLRMLAKYRPRTDIPNRDGVTAAEIMGRKRDPFFRELAAALSS